jgi:hypothetical protein
MGIFHCQYCAIIAVLKISIISFGTTKRGLTLRPDPSIRCRYPETRGSDFGPVLNFSTVGHILNLSTVSYKYLVCTRAMVLIFKTHRFAQVPNSQTAYQSAPSGLKNKGHVSCTKMLHPITSNV